MSGFGFSADENKVFNGVLLTANFIDNTSAPVEFRSYGKMAIHPVYSPNALSPNARALLQIEISPDATNWGVYGQWEDTNGDGMHTFIPDTYSLDQQALIEPIVLEIPARYFRIKVKEIGYTSSNLGYITVYTYSLPSA